MSTPGHDREIAAATVRQAKALEDVAREIKALRKSVDEINDNIRRVTGKYVAGVDIEPRPDLGGTPESLSPEEVARTTAQATHSYLRPSQKEH